MKRIPFLAVVVVLFAFAPVGSSTQATPVSETASADPLAFGWAVVVPDTSMAEVPTAAPVVVTFRVLHEGKLDRPLEGAVVVFIVRHETTGHAVSEVATSAADPTQYSVTLTFDRPGPWQITAMVHNVESMNPQITQLPGVVAVEDGEVKGATPVPFEDAPGPAYLTITDNGLSPWSLEVPAGLKVIITNESAYPAFIVASGGRFGPLDGPVRVNPGEGTMWYASNPGVHLLTFGPAPAFRVATVTIVPVDV